MTTKFMSAFPAAVSAGKSTIAIGLTGFVEATKVITDHEREITNIIGNGARILGNGIVVASIATDEWADSSDRWAEDYAKEHGRVIVR